MKKSLLLFIKNKLPLYCFLAFYLFINNAILAQCTFSENYTSSAGWAGSGFTISTTLNYNDNGHGTGGCGKAAATPYVFKPVYALGSVWTWDIDVIVNSSSLVAFQLATITDGTAPVCFTNAVNLMIGTNVNQLYLSTNGGSSPAIGIPLGVWRYVRIRRTSAVDFTLQIYSNPARTTLVGSTGVTVPPPGPQNLITLVHLGCNSCGSARVIDADLDNVCICDDVPLPVELLSFKARLIPQKQMVTCEWSTATEINNDYFTIEKTTDGLNYQFVAEVPGAGNSNTVLDYSFIDKNPYQGVSYYRLKQTDFNGQFSYSQLEPVNLETIDIISIYPNPAVNSFEYIIGNKEDTDVTVKIIDATGRIVYAISQHITKGLTKAKVDVPQLASGNYLLQIVANNNQLTQKQFLIKK